MDRPPHIKEGQSLPPLSSVKSRNDSLYKSGTQKKTICPSASRTPPGFCDFGTFYSQFSFYTFVSCLKQGASTFSLPYLRVMRVFFQVIPKPANLVFIIFVLPVKPWCRPRGIPPTFLTLKGNSPEILLPIFIILDDALKS